jgi:hypothetical protein
MLATRTWWTPGRIALGVIVVAMAAMWVYVLLPSSARPPANRLDSPAFGQAGQPICAATRAQIDALPRADTAATPQDRAALVASANRDLEAMLGRLAATAPTAGVDGTASAAWLADWHTYLGDREAWADQLAGGDDGPFLESMVAGQPISLGIDDFATANAMPDCATPYDV